MAKLKNIFVGFLVSFIGSIPLGYLNVIGLELYSKKGISSLFYYLLGVISIEVIVIYSTVLFASQLASNKKLIKAIDIFGVFFLLFLAFTFYFNSNPNTAQINYLDQYLVYPPFIIGVLLSALNFLQLPFWTAWNLYLINGQYITVTKFATYYYVFGTLLGTFLGMLGLIYFLNSVTQNTAGFSKYLMPVFIPLLFLIMAILQMIKVFKKYVR
ncbi:MULTISPECIES: hypothetical protein [unclassified Flavobacterium]|uniref:hypothetical protein n=1 Tax=unclassified Flavobacterium TaxID=196869 RepID=UPI003F90F494